MIWSRIEISPIIGRLTPYPMYPHLSPSCNIFVTNIEMLRTRTSWDWSSLSRIISIREILSHNEEPWSRHDLPSNRGITIDIVNRDIASRYGPDPLFPNATGYWSWWLLSHMVPIKDIRAHPEEPWDRGELSRNRNITVRDIMSLDLPSARGSWDWFWVSVNVTMEEVIAYPNMDWDRLGLSQNPNITIDIVHRDIASQDSPDPFLSNATGRWQWDALSHYVPIEDVIANPWETWHRDALSMNRGITLDIVHRDIASQGTDDPFMPNAIGDWDWLCLSQYVPIEDVRQNPREKWHKAGLSKNKGITLRDVNTLEMPMATGKWYEGLIARYVPIEDVRQNPEEKWNRYGLSMNRGITIEDVKYLGGKWYYGILSKYLPMSDIRDNMASSKPLPWSKEGLSKNPGITVKDVYSL